MNYTLIKDVIERVRRFEDENRDTSRYSPDADGFERWIVEGFQRDRPTVVEPDWEGKDKGRSPESVINTLIVHMNRYAKSYSRSAIYGSDFSTQEDFIYLINLQAFGPMSKMDLIKKNVHEKPAGMQIINRLISQGWVTQKESDTDRRRKVISITAEGVEALEGRMAQIRQATSIVTGDLTRPEKMELIRLLTKLNDFHRPIYDRNLDPEHLIETAMKQKDA